MKDLYMISLGGKVKGCNLEVHDVQFVAANHVDESVELLKNNWYGLADKLHMDSYKVINGADGYAVRLTQEKPESNKHLFFVHLGGYKKDSTQELHDVGLFIGETLQEVKERALKEMRVADIENHVDSIVCVETCMLSSDGEPYFVELSESHEVYDRAPDWFGYRRLDNGSSEFTI
jgi:hypothetical protein